MDQKLSKWLRWLEVIKGEVQDLVVTKHTFHEVQGLIKDNPLLHQPTSFYEYLSRTYVSHIIIGLRRQLKCDKQGISMARLFEGIIEHLRRSHAGTTSAYTKDQSSKDLLTKISINSLHQRRRTLIPHLSLPILRV